jgi:hypothetical protein
MQDKPSLIELVGAVQDFLQDKAMPELTGRTRFHARVAANVLAIIGREARFGDAFATAQHQRLQEILCQTGDLESLNRQFCDALACGTLDLNNSDVRTHLIKTTMGKLAIDQPNYAGYQRARRLGWPEEDGFISDDA